MNKLSKQDIAKRDEIITEVEMALNDLKEQVDIFNARRDKAFSELSTALDAYNDIVHEAWEDLAEPLARYNEHAALAREWKEDIAAKIEEYTSEKSDKWQDSDKGQAYAEWKSQFDDLSIEDIDADEPEQLEIEEPEELVIDAEYLNDTLGNLPEFLD